MLIDYEPDYEAMQHAWQPDLICNNCGFETDYEDWYNLSEFNTEEQIKAKLAKPEICPECKCKLERL